MSSRIEEILEVIREVQSLYAKGHHYRPISELRRMAVETVARRRHVTSNTIADKFIRQLRPQVLCTADFDRLLERYLQKSSDALRNILFTHAIGQDDEIKITEVLNVNRGEFSTSYCQDEMTIHTTSKPMQSPARPLPRLRPRIHAGKSNSRLKEQCEVLAKAIQLLSPLYCESSLLASQRQLIETTIGAAIWYLPQGNDLWAGKIPEEALLAHHPSASGKSPTLTKDHQYPRKVTAARLLSLDWNAIPDPAAELFIRYKKEYGTYNLVLKHENRKLMKYQRNEAFEDPAQAYAKAGIKLFEISHDELTKVKRRDATTIERILARVGNNNKN